jgi:protein-tyrosine-phosphatase
MESVKMRSVLFVCTANRCRSPMAEALFKQEVARRGETAQWQIQSAGTWTEPGLPATQFSQMVMERRQIDLAPHRSQPVDGELLRAAGVILVMTQNHRESLLVEFPEIAGRVYLLSQLVDRKFDIEDPYGGSLADYEVCADDIQNILTHGWTRLIELCDRLASPPA